MNVKPILWTTTATVLFAGTLAQAYNPYGAVLPLPAAGLPTPAQVPGKEISLVADMGIGLAAALLVPNPESVLAWDGSGGLGQGFDYSLSRAGAPFFDTIDRQVDAIANHGDALFNSLRADQATLIYSVSTPGQIFLNAAAAPVNPGAAAQDIELEVNGGPAAHGKWAIHGIHINSDGQDAPDDDVDGIEVWGPEPAFGPNNGGDADRYSLANDATTPGSTSVWAYDANTHTSTAFIPLFGGISITDAVTQLLGDLPTSVEPDSVDLDALMVRDNVGEPGTFNRDPLGGNQADRIIFSIRQIVDFNDPSGFYATGSELFVYDGNGVAQWLVHGGHLWDKAWALDNMVISTGVTDEYFMLDIDGIEAIATPEPATAALLALGGIALLRRRS